MQLPPMLKRNCDFLLKADAPPDELCFDVLPQHLIDNRDTPLNNCTGRIA